MQIKRAEFITSSPDLRRMPLAQLPEFAFAGRSNVGKSSLINYLCSQKNLAKTGATPGKTRLINQFRIDGRWSLIDLPGYGYARVSQSERQVFRKMIVDYATKREALYTLFVLVDANISPQKLDLEFINEIGSQGVPLAVIFTKTDRSRQSDIERNVQAFQKSMLESWEELPPVFRTSASKRQGAETLLEYIHDCLTEVPFTPPAQAQLRN